MSNPFGLRGRYMDITHAVGFTEHSLFQVLNVAGFENIYLMGAYRPGISPVVLGGRIVHILLKILFVIQGYPPPKILDKDVIAIAVKG